ncbi:tripartite tricarboxylate transporter substrate-binding protein [Pararhodobacter sp. CCB-MM2]|uniref:tripartite tricarboxylate transporter substrate-binding protein n=1 Tax=Pararhodobacter sp. CCB-MM2 TaxID=1786003 RepID=UPI0009F5ABD2|nr:tripartite tricarboxylate transporter substrate-binding protein [Pararhodobacter sp. CCB-MM2]MCA2012263.1 tripartite tricarboxylate transporter substrate-binding protein [Cereibacter sphaeroides]
MIRAIPTCAAVLLAGACFTLPATAQSTDWTPPGPITLMIGFAAGGGADTQARLVAQGIEDATGWTVLPQQVTGNSGLNLAQELRSAPADGSVIGMIVTETLAYNAVRLGNPDLQADQFTPLATTAAFQLGLVAMAGGDFASWDAVQAAQEAGRPIRLGAATERQADMAYHLSLGSGIEFNIVQVQGGAEIMNGLRAGDLDLGWVAGAQAGAVRNGEMVNVASGIPTPLVDSPDAPTIRDLGSNFYLDGYFMFVAPAGIPDDARAALAGAIASVVQNPETEAGALITRSFGGASVLTGADLDAYLQRAVEDSAALIDSVR